MAFKGWEDHAEHYFINSIPAPPAMPVTAVTIPMTDC